MRDKAFMSHPVMDCLMRRWRVLSGQREQPFHLKLILKKANSPFVRRIYYGEEFGRPQRVAQEMQRDRSHPAA